MLRIGICDDDKSIAAELEKNIVDITAKKLLDCNIDVFYDGSTLKEYMDQGNMYDIIYLDIEMKKMNGIEVAKYIRNVDDVVVLIYVSSYDSYLMDLFQVEPFRFIKKPIKKLYFEEVFLKAYQKVIDKCAYFYYRYNKMDYKVLVRDILYFESKGRTVRIVMSSGDIRKFYGKLDEAEKMLLKGKIPFLRIHQSYLVNFHQIVSISYTKVVMNKDIELQISEERQRQIRLKYLNVLKGEMND